MAEPLGPDAEALLEKLLPADWWDGDQDRRGWTKVARALLADFLSRPAPTPSGDDEADAAMTRILRLCDEHGIDFSQHPCMGPEGFTAIRDFLASLLARAREEQNRKRDLEWNDACLQATAKMKSAGIPCSPTPFEIGRLIASVEEEQREKDAKVCEEMAGELVNASGKLAGLPGNRGQQAALACAAALRCEGR